MPRPPADLALRLLTSFGAFLFFAAMFAIPSGFSYGAVLLLIASFWLLARPRTAPAGTLTRADLALMAALFAYAAIPSLMTWALGNNPTDYDQYSRALLAMPILWLLVRVRVPPRVLWAGIAIGVILSAPLAWWQVDIQGEPRAQGFLNIIHFSNLTLTFTVFCVGALFWAGQQGALARRWRLLLTVAIACGLYSVIVGGSRGSWVALPPLAVVFLIAFLRHHNARRLGWAALAAVVIVTALFAMPDSVLRARYDRGVQDITLYHEDDTDTSIGARFEMWRGAWANLRQHPVGGWNVQDYTRALQRQIDAGTLTPVALEFRNNLHNNYIQAWVFTGLPGLLALLALYAVPLWHFGRSLRARDVTTRVLAFCGTSTVVAYLCFSLTQVILRRNNGIMFYLLAVLIFWGALRHARDEARDIAHRAAAAGSLRP